MAVEDKYIASGEATKILSLPQERAAGQLIYGAATFEVAAADDDGSKYRIFRDLPSDLIPVKIDILCDAMTGSTDWDLGFYDSESGAVVDVDALMDGADLSGGKAQGSEQDGMAAVGVDEVLKTCWELAGKTTANKKNKYDLVLTANTVGSAAGTVSVRAWFTLG